MKKEIFAKNLITQFLDPRSYPYYAQKIASGAANIPELAFRFPAALASLRTR